MKVLKRAMWIISFLPFVITALIIPGLPDIVPIHYDSSWRVDGYGSKYVDYLLPAVVIVFTAIFALLIRNKEKAAEAAQTDKERQDNLANAKTIAISTVGVTAGFAVMQCAFLYGQSKDLSGEALSSSIIAKVTYISVAVLLIIMGNYIPRTKRNGLIGLRCTWSMYNDVTWERSNRFGGRVLFITGIVMLIITLVVGYVAAAVWTFVLIALAVVIMLIYAKKVYTEQKALDDHR